MSEKNVDNINYIQQILKNNEEITFEKRLITHIGIHAPEGTIFEIKRGIDAEFSIQVVIGKNHILEYHDITLQYIKLIEGTRASIDYLYKEEVKNNE